MQRVHNELICTWQVLPAVNFNNGVVQLRDFISLFSAKFSHAAKEGHTLPFSCEHQKSYRVQAGRRSTGTSSVYSGRMCSHWVLVEKA